MTKWIDRVDRAERNNEFSFGDHLDSQEWPSCAISELDDRIRGDGIFGPEDSKLEQLGNDFPMAIGRHDFEKARLILADIKVREAQVLADLGLEPRGDDGEHQR